MVTFQSVQRQSSQVMPEHLCGRPYQAAELAFGSAVVPFCGNERLGCECHRVKSQLSNIVYCFLHEYRVYSEQASKLDCTRTRREPSMAAALTKCIRTVARTRASCEGLKLLVCHSWYWRRGIILTEVDSNEPEFAFTNLFTGSPEFGSLSLLLPCLKRRCPRVGEERTKPGRRSSCLCFRFFHARPAFVSCYCCGDGLNSIDGHSRSGVLALVALKGIRFRCLKASVPFSQSARCGLNESRGTQQDDICWSKIHYKCCCSVLVVEIELNFTCTVSDRMRGAMR